MGLAKLVQLFTEGAELVLGEDPNREVLWIAKMSAFQEEQANQAGRVARARRVLAVKEIGTPEFAMFTAAMSEASTEEVVEAIARSRSGELFMRVIDQLRMDAKWRERIEMLEQSDVARSDEERELLNKIETQYNTALVERHDEEMASLREELAALARDELHEAYRQTYLDEQGYLAFTAERLRWQLYFSMRQCAATIPLYGTAWKHEGCNHQALYLDRVEDVDQLPSMITGRVAELYAKLTMAPSLARFTGALSNSSDSPERSAPEEAKPASSPEETPTEPATT